jgi:glyoxalase family protein
MKLGGLHHITMITGDARRNVEFYANVLGLRMVKKTVNFDAPEAYHLYFGDEEGTPGSILTWFEFPGAARGRAGNGMIHTLRLGAGSEPALTFWADRLGAAGYRTSREADSLRFADYDGLAFELVVTDGGDSALAARHPAVPPEHAITALVGARAYGGDPATAADLLVEPLGFQTDGAGEYCLAGEQRRFELAYDEPPPERGIQGAGTVHHIAWASRDEDHLEWRRRLRQAGASVTDVRDRDYFKSIYFREPHGVLFEIATLAPGFAVDEDPDHLGEALRLPRMHEHLRAHLESALTPLVNPRATGREGAVA